MSENSEVASRPSSAGLRGVVSLQLVVVCMMAVGGFMLYEQQAEMGLQRTNLERHARTLDDLNRQVGNQTALLGRAIGEALPIRMSEEWETKHSQLGALLADKDKWPGSIDDAEQFHGRVRALIRDTPRWAEDEFLLSLNSLRWASQFFLLRRSAMEEIHWDSLEDYLADLQHLQTIAPEDTSSDLLEALQQHIEDTEEDSRRRMKDGLREYAQTRLQDDAVEVEELASVAARLQWLDTGGDVTELVAELRRRALEIEVLKQVARLQARYEALRELGQSLPELLTYGSNHLESELAAMQVRLAEEGLSVIPLEAMWERLRELSRHIQERNYQSEQRMWLGYQRWALGEITRFRKEYEEANKLAKDNARLKIGSTWTDEEFQTVADAARRHLIPIDYKFLDWLVREEYDSAMRDMHKTLDDKDADAIKRQLFEDSANIERKGLYDVTEGGR